MLAEAGAVVVVTGRTDAPCKAVVERIRAAGHQAHFPHLDVTQEEDWRTVMDELYANVGGLDVPVNNAGIEMVKALADLMLEDWHRVCRVNLDGVFLGTKYRVQAMTEGSTTRPMLIITAGFASLAAHGQDAVLVDAHAARGELHDASKRELQRDAATAGTGDRHVQGTIVAGPRREPIHITLSTGIGGTGWTQNDFARTVGP